MSGRRVDLKGRRVSLARVDRECPWQRHCLLQSLSALLLLAIRKPVSRRVSRPVSIS